jgi:hypothetical protein
VKTVVVYPNNQVEINGGRAFWKEEDFARYHIPLVRPRPEGMVISGAEHRTQGDFEFTIFPTTEKQTVDQSQTKRRRTTMAWARLEDKETCKALILEGKSVKDIIEALGKRCEVSDVYGIRYALKKEGKNVPKPRRGSASATPGATRVSKRPATRKSRRSDVLPFVQSLIDERDRLQEEIKHRANLEKAIEALDNLIERYDNDIPLPKSLRG